MKTPIYNGLAQSDLDAAGYRIFGLPTPSSTSDAATKAYVDAHAGGGGDSGGGLPVTSIKDAPYNAAGDGVTDDTTALQSAINDLAVLGGGRIYFPPGTYLISGALQPTGGSVNAQILLPSVPTTSAPVTIEFIGALAPTTQFYVGSPTSLPATAYSTIKSTLTGASGSDAFIGGIESGAGLWNNVQLIVRDMVFQAPPNPTFTMFNCYNLMGPHFERVLIYTGSVDINTITEPTHSNAVGIKVAPSSHSTGSRLNVVNVFGFYTGMQDGELAETHANFWGCKQAVLVPFTFHLSTYRHLGVFLCTRGIAAAGAGYTGMVGDDGTHYMRVFTYSGEVSNSAGGFGQAWMDRVYDVDDASNLLKGDLRWLTILGGVGNNHTFVKNGGTGLLTSEMGDSSVYVGTDARLVAISGGTKLEARNTGTGTWVEAARWTNP